MNAIKKIRLQGWIFLVSLVLPALAFSANSYEGVLATQSKDDSNRPFQAYSMTLADIDGDGLSDEVERVPTDGIKKLFYLAHRPIHKFSTVTINGVGEYGVSGAVPEYTYNLEEGWISFRTAYDASDVVNVGYEWSNDLDVIVGNGGNILLHPLNQENAVYLNEPGYGMTERMLIPGGGHEGETREFVAACFTNDSDIDLVEGNWETNIVHINDGSGNFSETYLRGYGELAYKTDRMKAYDYDGDGDPDLARVGGSTLNHIFQNIGPGVLSQRWIVNITGGVQSVDFTDFDNDGDADLSIAGLNSELQIWNNVRTKGPFLHVVNQTQLVSRIDRYDAQDDLTYVDSYGVVGSNSHNLDRPKDIVGDDQNLYISDTMNHRIMIRRKSDYELVATFGSQGPGPNQFNQPEGLAIDLNSEYLYVADKLNNRIVKLDVSNLPTIIWELDVGLKRPRDLAIDDKFLYVLGGANSAPDPPRLQMRWLEYGLSLQFEIAAWGGAGGEFNNPMGIDLDRTTDRIYVADTGNTRIQVFQVHLSPGPPTIDATPIKIFPMVDKPNRVAVGNDRLYVGKTDENEVDIFDLHPMAPFMSLDKSFGEYGLGQGQFSSLYGIYFDDNPGEVHVTKFEGPVWTAAEDDMATQEIKWVDLNNDDKLDLVMVTWGSYYPTRVYINETDTNGVPILNLTWQAPTKTRSRNVSMSDINQDGYLDLIVVLADYGTDPDRIKIYLNNHNGTFTYDWGSDQLLGAYNKYLGSRVSMADMNNDGNLEMVVTAENDPNILSGEPTGIQVFRREPIPRIIKITSESGVDLGRVKIINFYSVNPDGTLGGLIASEIK